jgi:hypothetical protein
MRVLRQFSRGGSSAYLLLLAAMLFSAVNAAGQEAPAKSQEIAESDGLPVLVKHLPDWERVNGTATFATNKDDLKRAIGDRPVLDALNFEAGTEAVTAPYEEGKLLIVEFATPQGSAEADALVRQKLAQSPTDPPVVYRRIGNYNAFVFDAADESAASELLDQVKYEKRVQWLGENPFEFRRMERAFVYTFRDLFIATVLWIILGMGGSILVGIGVGYVYFVVREKQRARQSRFSDAGGLTRLNLDDLSEPIFPK